MGSGGCRGRSLKASIVAVLFVSLVIWLLFISILASQASEKSEPRISSSTRNLSLFTLIANRRNHLPRGPNFHSVSKRRVPNGPDPIHNRRVPTIRA